MRLAQGDGSVKPCACIISNPAIASSIDADAARKQRAADRIGLTGLAFAFLLVLLGSVISRSSRDDSFNAAQQAATNQPSEPLAELGVAPGAANPPTTAATALAMNRARAGALLTAVVLLALLLVAIAVTRGGSALPERRPGERPTLLLLTSLPLIFSEDFSLTGGGSPALTALQKRYRVQPISTTSPKELAKGRLLLMAQPMAEPPEELVALDQWVRQGGRLLLLADPMFEWPSDRPLGDRLRAADRLHRHRAAGPLGAAPRGARPTRAGDSAARRHQHRDGFARLAVTAAARSAATAWSRIAESEKGSDDRRRCRLLDPMQLGPARSATSTQCSPSSTDGGH